MGFEYFSNKVLFQFISELKQALQHLNRKHPQAYRQFVETLRPGPSDQPPLLTPPASPRVTARFSQATSTSPPGPSMRIYQGRTPTTSYNPSASSGRVVSPEINALVATLDISDVADHSEASSIDEYPVAGVRIVSFIFERFCVKCKRFFKKCLLI